MSDSTNTTPNLSTSQVRWRSVALPAEHGGWAMLFGPILLGLLVAPSFTAIFIAILYISAFLARSPLKIVWKNTQRGRRTPRTVAAVKALGIYGLLIIGSFGFALTSGGALPLEVLARWPSSACTV